MAVIDYITVAVRNTQKTDRLLIHTRIGQYAVGHGQLQGRDSTGTQRQSVRRCVDVIAVNAHAQQKVDRAIHAYHGHQGLCSGNVIALSDGIAQGFRTDVAAGVVISRPRVLAVGAGPSLDGNGHIVDHAGRRSAQFNGRGIHGDGLDGGADGHLHVDGAVQGLALRRPVAAAHDRLQFTCAVIQHHSGGLRLLDLCVGTVIVPGTIDLVAGVAQRGPVGPRVQRIFDDLLNFRVNSQGDAVAARAQLVFHLCTVLAGVFQIVQLKETVDNVGNRIFHVVRILIHPVALGSGSLQHIRRGGIQRLLILCLRDKLVFIHAAQHVVGAVVGQLSVVRRLGLTDVEVPAGIVIIGVVRQPGQHGAFAQRQLTQAFAEVTLRGYFHAVVVLAEVNGVQVAFQNLRLGIAAFQLHGQIGFLNFTLVALLTAQHCVFDQLLGDGGAALLGAGSEVGNKRTDDSLHVDAVMGIKTSVLHSHEGIAEILRHGGNADHYAVFSAFIVGNDVALRVVQEGGLILIAQKCQVQIRGCFHIALSNPHHRSGQCQPTQHDHQRKQPQRVDTDGDQQIRLGKPWPENTEFFSPAKV